MVIKLHRRAELFDPALVQHDDAVGHRHRLDLVMGDIDHGGGQVAVQLAKLDPHVAAQGGVEVGERFVEQEDLGVAHDGAANGDALALAAGQLAGLQLQLVGQLQDLGRFGDLGLDLGLGQFLHAQREGDVFEDRQMGVKRIALEHHRDAAIDRGKGRHIGAVDHDLARSGGFQTCDDAQEGGLAAAGGADEDDEFLVLDGKVDALQHLGGAKVLGDLVEVQRCHRVLSAREG